MHAWPEMHLSVDSLQLSCQSLVLMHNLDRRPAVVVRACCRLVSRETGPHLVDLDGGAEETLGGLTGVL